jgi:tetratricopeptide (TPR) repeat protein
MNRLLVVACALLVGLSRAAAADEQTDKARIHVKAAIDYYDQARYDDAAREMNAAYELKPLADLQYNLAQCYERLNRLPEAVAAYQKYADGKPDAPDREQVLERIFNLNDRIKKGETSAPPVEKEKVVFKTIVVYREVPPPPGRAARWAAYGCFGLAAAGLATGIAFTVLAKQSSDQVTSGGNKLNPMPFAGAAASAQDSGKIDPIIAGVGFGVAALAAGGGIALFLVGRKIDRETPKLTLAPTFSPTGGGVAAAWRF